MAHDNFVYIFFVNAGAFDGFFDCERAELRSGERAETAVQYADGGATSGNDICIIIRHLSLLE
jgi:hypothetical protein